MKLPRLMVAGTHSGVGKTTVAAGLCQALKEAGLRPQPFKTGPDYIDPEFLTRAAGRLCRNLDGWMIPKERLPLLFAQASAGHPAPAGRHFLGSGDGTASAGAAGVGLIEGVMGLYDGTGPLGEEGSSAELAKLLDCPVLLVLDASAVSRSAAAMVRGFAGMDRRVRISGCFLNRVAGPGHYRLVKEGIERLAGVPVVGYLPRDPRLALPERHLGLVPAPEQGGWSRAAGPLRRRFREGVDLQAILRIARSAAPLPLDAPAPGARERNGKGRVFIGLARDEAFHFYYPENLELLESLGAEFIPFSPLKGKRLPRGVDALYLGGGFPELFAKPLSRNRAMLRAVRQAVLDGMPAYAECGGLMYLARSIRSAGQKARPMVGLLPAEIRMTGRLQNFGYREVRARASNLLARAGEKARGHEFHYSVLSRPPSARRAAYEVRSPRGEAVRPEGYAAGSLLASYVHLHFWSQPRWARRFVEAARAYQERKG